MASDIFLSYCRADQQLADQFVTFASDRGLSVWYDQMIEGGDDWRSKIVDAVSSARALVILFSDHSNASRQLIKELAIADNFQKTVIPVLIASCQPRGAYLYELASRNWVNLHPNPESRLASLIEKLLTEIDFGEAAPSPAPAGMTREPAPQSATSIQNQLPRAARFEASAPSAPAKGRDESWFPLKRYDLYVLVPVLAAGFLIGIFGEGDDKSAGLGLSSIAFFSYMLVIAVRNARLNRSIFSGRSFASYFAVLAIGSAPALVTEGTTESNVTAFLGLLIISLFLAVVANVLQVALRKIFQQNIFRSNIDQPLAARTH